MPKNATVVIGVTAARLLTCDMCEMKKFDPPPSYLARIREYEVMAADTASREMVGVLRRLVLAYREVARSEMCGGARTNFTAARSEPRPAPVARGTVPAQIQALTRG